MRLIWDIDYDYDEAYVVGIREGLARWWEEHTSKKLAQTPPKVAHDSVVVDISPFIAYLDPDTSAFQTMLMNIPHGPGTVMWVEDELFPRIGSLDLWSDWQWVG